jgi:cytidine deaminase
MKLKKVKAAQLTEEEQKLIEAASNARMWAYAPYSRFRVGAAILTEKGKQFTGCNVENVSYGASLCAERSVVARAVVEGHQKFRLLAIVTGTSPPAPPCGICRQVLEEFCDDLDILLANPQGEVLRASLDKLLPAPFTSRPR